MIGILLGGEGLFKIGYTEVHRDKKRDTELFFSASLFLSLWLSV